MAIRSACSKDAVCTSSSACFAELFDSIAPQNATCPCTWRAVVQAWMATAVRDLTFLIEELLQCRNDRTAICAKVFGRQPTLGSRGKQETAQQGIHLRPSQLLTRKPSRLTQLFLSVDAKHRSPWWTTRTADSECRHRITPTVFAEDVDNTDGGGLAQVVHTKLLVWLFAPIDGLTPNAKCRPADYFTRHQPVPGTVFETLRVFDHDLLSGIALPEDALADLVRFYADVSGVWEGDPSHLPPSLGLFDRLQSAVDQCPADKGTMASPRGAWLAIRAVTRSRQAIVSGDWNALLTSGGMDEGFATLEALLDSVESRFAGILELAACGLVLESLQRRLASFAPAVELLPFGSTQTGLALRGTSDLDVCVRFLSGERLESDRQCVSQLLEHLTNDATTATMPDEDYNPRRKQGPKVEISHVEAVHATKRSFLRLRATVSLPGGDGTTEEQPLSVELVPDCKFDTNLANTRYFTECFRHPKVLRFVRFVRVWSAANGLTEHGDDRPPHLRTYNNYYWMHAAVCALQCWSVLPFLPITEHSETEPSTAVLVEPPEPADSVRRFFDFFGSFDFAHRLMDLRAPGWMARSEFMRLRQAADKATLPAKQGQGPNRQETNSLTAASSSPPRLIVHPFDGFPPTVIVGICTYSTSHRQVLLQALHRALVTRGHIHSATENTPVQWPDPTTSDREETAQLTALWQTRSNTNLAASARGVMLVDATLTHRRALKIYTITRAPVVVLVPGQPELLLLNLLQSPGFDLTEQSAREQWDALRKEAVETVARAANSGKKYCLVPFYAVRRDGPENVEFTALHEKIARFLARPSLAAPQKLHSWLVRAGELCRPLELDPSVVAREMVCSLEASLLLPDRT